MNSNLFRRIRADIGQALHRNHLLLPNIANEEIVGWGDINSLLESGLLDFPRVRVSSAKNPYTKGYMGFLKYSSDPRGGRYATISPELFYRALNDGCTVVIDGCQSYFPKVFELTKILKEELGCRAWANLYISLKSATSFGCHFDDHDVISVQLYGKKIWNIHNPTYPNPNRGDKSFYLSPPTSPPIASEHLLEGHALYLPCGYWHDVETLSEHSLHITFGLDFPRKLDIIRSTLNHLAKQEFFREPIDESTTTSDIYIFRETLLNAIRNIEFEEVSKLTIRQHQRQSRKFHLPKLKG